MSAQSTGTSSGESWFTPQRIKWITIGGVVLALAVAVFFIWRGVSEDKADESWDTYTALRREYEPRQDPLWNDPFGVYGAQRDRYVQALEAFLDDEASKVGGALEPQVRWRIARTLADHVIAMKDVLDPEARAPYYERASQQLEAIRDQHPDFPLNWSMFAPTGFPSLTRKFLVWLESNKEWEAKYLPTPVEPDGDHTIVIRTTRGDMHLKLYRELAPDWTENFVSRAVSGFYDGLFLLERRDVGDDLEPRETTVRGAMASSRGLKPYDWERVGEILDEKAGGGMLPPESRNRIPFERGIVAAWHDVATVYDDPVQLLFTVRRSPQLDYDYTPIGKLVDDASLATLDRIFEGDTWVKDPKVAEDAPSRGVLDVLQVPIEIKKVLVYDDSGKLIEPSLQERAESWVEPDSSEQLLSSLKADAYVEPVPERG